MLATQNPLEQEGTYPLPEAQLDRFLMQIDVPYPEREAERRILLFTTGAEETPPRPAMTRRGSHRRPAPGAPPAGRAKAWSRRSSTSCAPPARTTTAELAGRIAWGPGPRASQALMLAVRARALLDGRFAPSVDDVVALAEPVLKHRMALTFAARAEGETIEGVIGRLGQDDRLSGWRRPAPDARGRPRPRPRMRAARARSRPRAAAPRHRGEAGRRAPWRMACTAAARPGVGENFWQFRPFTSGEAAARVDWRRSARDDHLYVREREWEAAQTVWLWIDRSPSMAFVSDLAAALEDRARAGAGLRRRRSPGARAASGSA